ncbi:MAG: SulP family inorganic anion transporter [Candidatus Yonathbacteria bacterium]|nr:SulP family inorganic anion transporter [Candidatus Yonathbacteria bacterium]NTW47966.1 SulP family inorganic anion transporter [Candidatus Yonathbacteria bacterium]
MSHIDPLPLLTRMKTNWRSGLTVSLVSIPLSVSLAVASQASPIVGIITAIWAGLMASLIGGSHYNIVGPTGALSGIIAMYVIMHGANTLPVLAMLSGMFIFVAYLLKLERYLVFIPGSAIHGFTLGVAFIIALNQWNFVFGLSGLTKHETFIDNLWESFTHMYQFSPLTVLVFALSLGFLYAMRKFTTKVPGAIILAPIGILLGYMTTMGIVPFSLQTLDTLYPNMHIGLFMPYSLSIFPAMIVPALTIALVAIIETMLSAKIADGMTGTKYRRRPEMRGLAVANIVSGLFGGMPATAALARTSLNVKTGANDKVSATISSIFIALISLLFLGYFKFIPLAVIGAILVFVAIQMVEAEHFKRMFLHDRKNFYVSLIVAFITVYEDPIVGILFGVGIASILLIEKLSRGQFDLVVNDRHKQVVGHMSGDKLDTIVKGSDTIVYSIAGLLCYVNGEAHVERFHTALNGYENVILRLRGVYYIDIDGVETIDEIIRTLKARGKHVYMTSVNKNICALLKESEMYRELKQHGHVFEKSADALRHLGFDIA